MSECLLPPWKQQWPEQKQTLHIQCCREQHPDELLKSHFVFFRTGSLGVCSQGHRWSTNTVTGTGMDLVLPQTTPSLETTTILHSSELALQVSCSACVFKGIRMLTGTGTGQCRHEQRLARKLHFRFCRPGSLGTFTMKGISVPEEVGIIYRKSECTSTATPGKHTHCQQGRTFC